MTKGDARAGWLGIILLAGCGGEVQVVDDVGASGAGGELDPRSCSVVEGDVDLIPTRDSPLADCSPITCTVFFGHGQHLTCPGWTHGGAWTAACSIGDCHCVDDETGAFFADFSTGTVVDERKPGVVCRYTMVPLENN